MTIFYFTGTGNSLFAARKISERTGAKLISIPQVIEKQQEYVDDCIGFVYPQYAVGLPKMVRRFILRNEFRADYIFAVDLYAFLSLGALKELSGIIPLNYGTYLKTPNNFISALNPPKNPHKVLAKAERYLDKIANDILTRKVKHVKPRESEGNATKYFGKARFDITDQCNQCGTCAMVCPSRNITLENGIVFGSSCENCFSCVNLCPQHAINSNKAMQKRKQYRNPFVTVSEIANANKTEKGVQHGTPTDGN
jgi:Pyruvate/2-oxoacid:ferredoxin oxidoreductase delta subunit